MNRKIPKLKPKNKRKKGTCAAEGCYRKTLRIVKGRKIYSEICSTCSSRKTRAKNPVRYAWINLKNHSAARGIPFDLPFEHFEPWCYEVSYHTKTGAYAHSYTVDRKNIDPAKGYWGYRIDNIQKLTRKKNSQKRHLEYDYVNGKFKVSENYNPQPAEDDYF